MYALEPPRRTTFASGAAIRRLPGFPRFHNRRRETTGVLASQSGPLDVKRSGPTPTGMFSLVTWLCSTQESVFRKSYLLLLMFLGRNGVRDKLQVTLFKNFKE